MNYQHILHYVASTPWAILPDKLTELLAVLAYRAAGHEFTAAEIRARIGDGGGPSGTAKRGDVAVIPIRGVIAHRMGMMDDTSGGTSCERIAGMLRQCVADPRVETIVFDVDSPGGTVTGMSELAAEIFAARATKHLIAVANGMMCSAAYDLGSQAHEIVSLPSGLVGSIGVFAAHEDVSGALEKEGIKVTLVSYGKYKTENNPFAALTPEGRAQIQKKVDQAGDQFVADVARGRGVSVSAVKAGFGQGRALSATESRSVGLIDRIGTLDSVVATALGRGAGLRGALAAHVTGPDQIGEAFRRRMLAPTAEERRVEAAEAELLETRRRRLR